MLLRTSIGCTNRYALDANCLLKYCLWPKVVARTQHAISCNPPTCLLKRVITFVLSLVLLLDRLDSCQYDRLPLLAMTFWFYPWGNGINSIQEGKEGKRHKGKLNDQTKPSIKKKLPKLLNRLECTA